MSGGHAVIAFGREKRLLLGVLALLAPLPLPWNDVLAWPVALLYGAAVLLFLRRAWRDPPSWLPAWAMNVLGLAYLPVLYVDLLVFWSGQLVRPVIHLALFAVAVKLYALRQERDKWHVVIGAFFLFLAAMGTSVHPAIMLYLAAFVGLGLLVLARFAWFSVLAGFGYRREEPARAPLGGFLVGATVAAMLLAAPLFALLPRIRTPYLLVRGAGTGTIVKAAGFSDEITLDSIGSTRIGHEVLLRLRFYPQPRPRSEIRLKAATYDHYDGRTWRGNRMLEPLAPQRGSFRLGNGRAVQDAEIWLLPWNSPSLPVPVETVGLTVRALAIGRDRGGAVALFSVPATTLRYDVELAPRPALDQVPDPLLGEPGEPGEPALGHGGVTPRIAALAAQAMGSQGDLETRVVRLEQFLATKYAYSTEFVGRSGQLSLEDFLFRERRGHCEFFATAMVVMLRSQGVPARFVTGFLGGDESDFEGYYIVRQSNAHAWVEAWIPGRGWQVFDPTPVAGRPAAPQRDFSLLMSEAWDYVHFRWDRYVLTYGIGDQLGLLLGLRSAWMRFWGAFEHNPAGQPAHPATATEPIAAAPGAQQPFDWRAWRMQGAVVLGAIALLVIGWMLWQRRARRRTATESYARLRDRLERSGLPVPESLAPLALVRRTGERFPAAGASARRLVELYLRESFAGEELASPELDLAGRALREVEQVLAKAG